MKTTRTQTVARMLATTLLLAGSVAWGQINVLNLDGDNTVSQAIEFDAPLILNGDFTVEFWYRLDRRRAGRWRLINSSQHANYAIGHSAPTSISFLNPTRSLATGVFSVTVWVHFAAAREGGTVRVFHNGVEQASGPWTGELRFDRIGGRAPGSAWFAFEGILSDVRVWDHARSAASIDAQRLQRLEGVEAGLIGYWPLDEGAGRTVHDRTGNARHGYLHSASSWVNVSTLAMVYPASAIVPQAPFTLANPLTGSTRFTNTPEVDVVDFPVPEGYTHFQLTTNANPVLPVENWEDVSAVPASLAFPAPAADTNLVWHAWFTNLNEAVEVPLRRSAGDMTYTVETLPAPVGFATRLRAIAEDPIAIGFEELDSGSAPGTYLSHALAVHETRVVLSDGPAPDAAPEAPDVFATATGDYEIALVVMNEAGNVATSAVPSQVSVVAAGAVAMQGGDWVFDTLIDGIPHRIHVFTNTTTATLSVSTGGRPAGIVDYLVVGGGGSGGGRRGGGGGASGVVLRLQEAITNGVYAVTVGGGGLANRSSGSASSVFDTVAFGGGGGGTQGANGYPGLDGGSGGGRGVQGIAFIPRVGVALQPLEFGRSRGFGHAAHDSGTGSASGTLGSLGTGGGGAGGAPIILNGGPGIDVSHLFTDAIGENGYVGGGGGGAGTGASSVTSEGGIGGGGGQGGAQAGQDGLPATGGGGGGGSEAVQTGGDGGSGIVVIRYEFYPGTMILVR